MDYFTKLILHISPDSKWSNLETPNKNKLEIIHDIWCPGKKAKIKKQYQINKNVFYMSI